MESSLQDEMFRKFNTEWANSIVLKLGLEENVPLEYGSLAKQASSPFCWSVYCSFV
jgi:hypothetical protein